MKGLIIKPYWADLILSGSKTLEIRGSNTNIRGDVGIIKSKSSCVFGSAELYDSKFLSREDFEELRCFHKIDITYDELLKVYPRPHGWFLRNVKNYENPIRYNHKRGCVIWVNL